jgi:DNA-binding NtrC family response regulator
LGREANEVLAIGLSPDDRAAVAAAAHEAGAGVRVAERLSEGLQMVARGRWTATVLELDPEGDELALLERLASQPGAGALVLVGRDLSPELAMRATQLGAAELLVSPIEAAAVAAVLRTAVSAGAAVPLPALRAGGVGLVGSSPALLEAFKTVGRVAASPATVLVTGESGTGKELVAQALHRMSPRATRPFVAVNCAAIPEDLLESELFGHERGAFTGAVARKVGRFERASGGTLFLDEIGDMSLVLQAKILRALQEKEIERLGGEERIPVDVRIVAATHRDLQRRIADGDFREDLYYRLAVVRVQLPPLRERGGDVRTLALHFAAHFASVYGRELRAFAAEALDRLEAHVWAGNVRELRNVVERAVLSARGETILPEHLEIDDARSVPAPTAAALPGYTPTLSMAEVEALHIARVLDEVDRHFGKASEILGMHRNTVSRKAQEYGIIG